MAWVLLPPSPETLLGEALLQLSVPWWDAQDLKALNFVELV